MRLGEVLERVEGLNKRFVYYLEAQGHIRPALIQKTRIARRDYSEADLERIRGVWEYYRRGYSVVGARELASRSRSLDAFAFLRVPVGQWQSASAILREITAVAEASFVYGHSLNLIVRVASPDEHEAHRSLGPLFSAGLVGGLPTIRKVKDGFGDSGSQLLSEPGEAQERSMQAYLLIEVPAKQAGGLLELLRSEPGVAEASVVYGETDIIARVVGSDQDSLDDLILHRIQNMPGVQSTRTYFVVGGMRWVREAPESELAKSVV